MSWSILFQFIIAFIFALSLFSKLSDYDSFFQEVESLEIIPHKLIALSVYSLLIFELFLVVSYVLDLFSVWRELFTITLLLFFIIILLRKTKTKNQTTCSCFGNDNFLNKYPIQRNLILILICILNMNIVSFQFQWSHSIFLFFSILLFLVLFDIWNTIKKIKVMGKIHDHI
ncbi:MauE/DoxX family redox-associated membrane protein [Paenibacillus sp. 481]|uniref:MauE/DoxX family redox-associated membrane protein n=1 Tax=Paenibacillus sp. 481 TaxID=2835869 RepID=UPI003FA71885|nr:hypothetical protein KIK04_09265 [Paenibacillus sp. 481]